MRYFLPFLLSILPAFVFAQISTTLDNNPPSLKWQQINTPNFRILFPKGFEDQAQRMANTMEHIRTQEANTMGSIAPRRISILLQNESSISNGFVSMMPRRSEFFAMPSQDYNFIGTNDWLNLLASHEYRHIAQYQHAMRGFNKFLYYVFGSTTFTGMAQAAAPEWFWEGDAVATETAFTPSGRGKIPNFGLVFRTNLLEGREFNYHKQYLQSYKHNIPNEYVLGYYMTSYLRKRTKDPEIWEKVTARSWNIPFIPFAFSNAIKKESDVYVTGLYREMVKDLRQTWKQQVDTLSLTPYATVSKRKNKAYTDYQYPQVINEGVLIAKKSGIGDIESFVLIKDGKESKAFTPGYVNDSGMLSAQDGVVVWNEYGYDARWGVRNFSLIKTFNYETGERKTIGSKKERFAGAAMSLAGRKIVTVRTDRAYKTQLVIIDYYTGKIIKEFNNPEDNFFSMPQWSRDGKNLIVLKTTSAGKTISRINIDTETSEDLLPITQQNLGYPVDAGDYILFNSDVHGIDNVLALKLSTRQIFQVTNSRYGAYNPCLSKDGKTLYYNDQSRNGLDVVSVAFDPTHGRSITLSQDRSQYDHLVEQEGSPDLFATVPQQNFQVTKYSKSSGIFNPYSWGFNLDTDLTSAQFGFASRDLLSTTSINLGYVFDINERTGAYQGSVSYQGLFPILDVRGSYATRKVDEGNWEFDRIISEDTVRVTENLNYAWKELTVEGGIRIPLNLTNSRFSSQMQFLNYVGVTNVNDFENSISEADGRILPYRIEKEGRYSILDRNYVDNGRLVYNQFGFTFSRLLKQSHRDINSRWGQSLFLNWYGTPYGGNFTGNSFSIYSVLYFPGLFKHHSFWGYGAYQSTEIDFTTSNYIFRNRIPLPRGISVSRFQKFYSLSGNYTLPLWYPDIAIGPVLNIQRFRSNFFMDYGYGENQLNDVVRTYSSVGVELKADINIMRFKPQFDIGIRISQGLQPATSRFEVLIGTFNF